MRRLRGCEEGYIAAVDKVAVMMNTVNLLLIGAWEGQGWNQRRSIERRQWNGYVVRKASLKVATCGG